MRHPRSLQKRVATARIVYRGLFSCAILTATIDERFSIMEKAHGQNGTVRGYTLQRLLQRNRKLG